MGFLKWGVPPNHLFFVGILQQIGQWPRAIHFGVPQLWKTLRYVSHCHCIPIIIMNQQSCSSHSAVPGWRTLEVPPTLH